MACLFFFSSRRRHTRCSRDWRSDVCSSDLARTSSQKRRALAAGQPAPQAPAPNTCTETPDTDTVASSFLWPPLSEAKVARSEERRVGKERGCRWSAHHLKKRLTPSSASRHG